MSATRRQAVLLGIMLLMLAVAALWSVQDMLSKRESAMRAADDLAQCRELAGAIESLREKPPVASTSEMAPQELGQRIESATQKAQMNPPSLEGVFPQASRRMGDSPYLQKPTVLALREVSLPQLAAFLFHLTDRTGLSLQNLRVRSPRGEGDGNLWDAEATLTYLIYAPLSKTAREK